MKENHDHHWLMCIYIAQYSLFMSISVLVHSTTIEVTKGFDLRHVIKYFYVLDITHVHIEIVEFLSL